jgi:hypothetical protein
MKINEIILNEFAAGGADRGGNYFRELASAWYNGVFDTGSLPKGIKTQEDVERLLNRGIVCPDGKTRKLHIDYNSDFDGVEIYSDDYYEHGDHDETDSRTGKPFGPYDYMEFSDEELDESLNEFAAADGDDNEPDEDEILHKLASIWWLGSEQQMIRVERTLASMGWEIGEDEGYDDGGVFVVRAGDENGKSYMSWPHEDLQLNEDWNKVNHRDKTSGMSRKAVKAYRREHPGSKLQTAVTTKPSKLKPGSKAAKRRKSFCARMSGNKGPMKKPNGKPTPKALALRRWNC